MPPLPRILRPVLAAALAALCAAADARAQAAPDPARAPQPSAKTRGGVAPIEEIEVTGTRLGRYDGGDYQPIASFSGDEIRRSGALTVDAVLRTLPEIGFQGTSANNNNGGRGRISVDLRDLGSDRTLILLNGRRVANEDGFVDLNTIPIEMLERVEVLGDAASTVYGTDAVAGVVNFVVGDRYEGQKLMLGTGTTEHGGGDHFTASLTAGRRLLDSRLNLAFNGTFTRRSPIHQRDRDWSRRVVSNAARVAPGSDADVLDGRLDGESTTFGDATVPEGVVRGGGLPARFFRPAGELAFQPFNARDPAQSYNAGAEQYLQGEVNRFNGLLVGSYEFGDDRSAFWEISYTRRQDRQQLAPQPLGPGNSRFPDGLGFDVFDPALGAGRNSRFLPESFVESVFPADGPHTSQDPVHFTLARRMVEAGNREFENTADALRSVGGFQGSFDRGWLDGFRWQVYASFSQTRTEDLTHNAIDLERALHTLDPAACEQHRDDGCVEGNYFGAGALQPDVVHYIRYDDRRRVGFRERSAGASANGALFELSAGPLAVSAGVEYRSENGFDRPSRQARERASASNTSPGGAGGFDVRDAFWEASIPLLRDQPLLDELGLNLSGRLTDYSSFGSHYVSRYELRYAPTAELLLRTYYSTAYRAPRVRDLFSSGRDQFTTLFDPCEAPDGARAEENCRAQLGSDPSEFEQANPRIRSSVFGNDRLHPEESHYAGAGVVYRPSWLADWTAQVEYYDIRLDDFIDTPDPQLRLDDCYASSHFAQRPECAASIRRDPAGQISVFELSIENQGRIRTRGLDFGLRYAGDSRLGTLALDASANYVFTFDVRDPTGKTRLKHTFEAEGGSQPRFKSSLRAAWSPPWRARKLTLQTTLQYIGGARNATRRGLVYDHVPSVVYWDFALGYEFQSGFVWIAGIDNLTDRKPPFVPGPLANTQINTYDLAGRRFFTRLERSF